MNLKIDLPTPYSVLIEKGLLDRIGELSLDVLKKGTKILVVSDNVVSKLYLSRVVNLLEKSGFKVFSYIINSGEESKNLDNFGKILNYAAMNKLCRDDSFLALGGGVCGDLCGFVAASYMRGVKYIQVPTTLLADIDSSVGGKTAVNLDEGKNMAGAFHQPSLVVIDTEILDSLNCEEWLCGLGEAVKYAVLCGGEILEILKSNNYRAKIERLIELCVLYKAKIVKEDEFENGQRKLLNLGHTIGHAVEKLSDFKIKHGICVAVGIKAIATADFKRGVLNQSDYNTICLLIDKYGFDTQIQFAKNELLEAIMQDKKMNNDSTISLVTIDKIGLVRVEKVDFAKLGERLCLSK